MSARTDRDQRVIHWLSPHVIAMIDCLADAYGTTPDEALARAVRRAFVASCKAEAEEGDRPHLKKVGGGAA